MASDDALTTDAHGRCPESPKRRRRLFRVLLAAFVGLCTWWIFHLPFNAARLYSAIPPGSTLITLHDDLDLYWRELAENPITTNVLYQAGIDAELRAQVLGNPDLPRAVKYLAGREVLVAHVPRLGASRKPAWIAASWVGGYGTVLRWLLAVRAPPEIREIGEEERVPIYMLDRALRGGTERLSFAVLEGVAVACYSPDPAGVRYLVARIAHTATPAPELVERLHPGKEHAAWEAAPNHVWFHGYRRQGRDHRLVRTEVALSRHDRSVSAGRVRVDLPTQAHSTHALDVAQAVSVFGTRPCACAVFPAHQLIPWLGSAATNELVVAIREIMDTCRRPDSPVLAAMYGDDMSGRLMGLRVPGFVLGTRARTGVNTQAVMVEAVDRLNAERGWALLLRHKVYKTVPMIVIDGTRDDVFSKINAEEKPAFTMRNGWLLLGSNLETLAGLCSARNAGEGALPEWARELKRRDAPLTVWMDLKGASKALTHAIAVYWLVLKVSDKPDTDTELAGKKVAAAGRWVIGLESLRQLVMWGSADERGYDLQFRFGTDMDVSNASRRENHGD